MNKPHALTGKPSNNAGKYKAGAKRSTLALRITAEHKATLQTQAKAKGVSVSRHIVDLSMAFAALGFFPCPHCPQAQHAD
jgi:hypothetical protein